ncbi:MAG TPA: efflux RND transporter permease subunit [Planctomycetota bacterium]|nr:efflux RND transporter permease subunit [Planctomycetota bacterium]
MWLINLALRRPFTILVAVLGVALGAGIAVKRMPVDIFPDLNIPVIYVAQPYGGMDPSQMEGYLVYYYEYHFLYITGIEHVESKSIQNTGLVKLFFHPGTDMSQALAQTVSYVERSRAFMPPGTVPPFIMRFDAGSVPVGQLVLSSQTRPTEEVQDLALNRVRPMFAKIPGVSAPPPFGASQRTVVIRVDPGHLREYQMAPEEIVKAVSAANLISPAGNVRIADINRMTPVNSVVTDIQELASIPIRTGSGPTVYLRDVGKVVNAADILTSYALVDNRRTIYINVTKRADASTLDVVDRVRTEIPRMQTVLDSLTPQPGDIRVSFEFDQSIYVKNSLRGLGLEGALGACLTGLMVLLFLRDFRSALIVVLTIPFALLGGVVGLWLTGQTLNIMTLGGLALAIGVLVDEATVAIENIHVHLARGTPRSRAVFEATRETIVPRFLAMLSILAVFVPSFFMVGISRALFVPLSLAVGFSMLGSYLLSSSFVPILSVWFLGEKHGPTPERTPFERFQAAYGRILERLLVLRWPLLLGYLGLAAAVLVSTGGKLGTDIFPTVDAGQFQLRLRAPTGTRVERTEVLALKTLEAIREVAGPEKVDLTLSFVGVVPASYPINAIFLWTSGPHEAVLLVALKKGSGLRVADLKERLRAKLPSVLPPGTSLSFEAGDIVTQIMNFGAPTPIEVSVQGPNFAADRAFAEKVMAELRKVESLRDLQYALPLDYPTLDIRVDRERAAQLGMTMREVSRSLTPATSSSRYVDANYWRDPNTGIAYQIQVEVPQFEVQRPEDVESLPVVSGAPGPLVADLARVSYGTMPGEYDRYNMERMVLLSANIAPGRDLRGVTREVEKAVASVGEPPKGVSVNLRGQVPPMNQTLAGLTLGLGLAIAAIFLLLMANFQSIRLPLVVLSTVPAIVAGVAVALRASGTTLNVQSFMGAIMSIGVGVANAILLVTFAERARREGQGPLQAAVEGARSRLRPILMTSFAMIAGMVPMALALGEGGEQTAPLGRAVIGGLTASTLAVLLVLPACFAVIQARAGLRSVSIHPEDLSAPASPVKG